MLFKIYVHIQNKRIKQVYGRRQVKVLTLSKVLFLYIIYVQQFLRKVGCFTIAMKFGVKVSCRIVIKKYKKVNRILFK